MVSLFGIDRFDDECVYFQIYFLEEQIKKLIKINDSYAHIIRPLHLIFKVSKIFRHYFINVKYEYLYENSNQKLKFVQF